MTQATLEEILGKSLRENSLLGTIYRTMYNNVVFKSKAIFIALLFYFSRMDNSSNGTIFLISICVFILLVSCESRDPYRFQEVEDSFYDMAFEYRERSQVDSAFKYFSKAKNAFIHQNDSFGAGKCLVNMAIILTDESDYFGGQEMSLEALDYFDPRNLNHSHYLGSNYNNLGIATFKLNDHDNALKFYDKAILFSDDSSDTRVYLNNKARAFQQSKNYNGALEIYLQIFDESFRNQAEYARTMTNIAVTKWLQNPDYNAKPELLTAFQIRQEEKDIWGQNSSYTHLSDYYTKNQVDSALFYARKRYQTAKVLKSADDQIEGLKKLIRLSPPDSVKTYFETYQRLRDSVQLARSAAKNQFALIRYEVEKNKADNLRLEQENAAKAYEVNRQRVVSGSAIFLAFGFGLSGYYWYRRRKERLELEARGKIRDYQLKTSKKVHDVVANGIYGVMKEIEYQDQADKEDILDRLEEMYEKSRDISYEDEAITLEQPDFADEVARTLKSFASNETKVFIVGNAASLWKAVPEGAKRDLMPVLQELMVNMDKHSHARSVVVKFEQADKRLHVHYSDDGMGLPAPLQKGNGLRNTENRIEGLGGHITFDSIEGKGLKVLITIPLS